MASPSRRDDKVVALDVRRRSARDQTKKDQLVERRLSLLVDNFYDSDPNLSECPAVALSTSKIFFILFFEQIVFARRCFIKFATTMHI
jgi:hypothetical protein